MNRVDISKKKILFLGYGGVAKATLFYLDKYFDYDIKKVYLVDKCKTQFYGPHVSHVKAKICEHITTVNFCDLLERVGIKPGDIIIDLSTSTATYYFFKICLEKGYNYINTSIEDGDDPFFGTSIDVQHKQLIKIYNDVKKNQKIKCNVLTECGQNPGMIQHYILHGLNQMNKLRKKTTKDDYSKEALLKAVSSYKVGTIFCSEIDNMYMKKEIKNYKDMIYNTWSVSGLLDEGFDKTELVVGKANKFIQPVFPKKMIDFNKMDIIPKDDNQEHQVIFLKDNGMNNTLSSVCPVLNSSGDVVYKQYRGHLIHHGEMFEMARYFGKKAPFMTYCYKINRDAEQSITNFFLNNQMNDDNDLSLRLLNKCGSFFVIDNIDKPASERVYGHDTIGATFFCGTKKVERAFWCGSILSDTDNIDPNFTPTIVQVAAGVLSGLSYIMEPKNKNKGWIEPCEMDTKYILEKATPLLGKFFFTEIPTESLKDFSFDYKRK